MNPKLKLASMMLVATALGLGGVWILHDALSDGIIRHSGQIYTRDGTPFGYWRMVLVGGFGAAIFVVSLIGLVWVYPSDNRRIDAWLRRRQQLERPDKRSGP